MILGQLSVVVNRPIWRTFIRSHGKPKPSFPLDPFLTIFSVKNCFYGNEDLDLVILHSYIILEYDLNHFYTIFVHSYLSPEHFYMILNTLIRSWRLLYDPESFFLEHFSVITKQHYSLKRNTHNQQPWIKKLK